MIKQKWPARILNAERSLLNAEDRWTRTQLNAERRWTRTQQKTGIQKTAERRTQLKSLSSAVFCLLLSSSSAVFCQPSPWSIFPAVMQKNINIWASRNGNILIFQNTDYKGNPLDQNSNIINTLHFPGNGTILKCITIGFIAFQLCGSSDRSFCGS